MERFDILDICRRPLGYTRAWGEKLAPENIATARRSSSPERTAG